MHLTLKPGSVARARISSSGPDPPPSPSPASGEGMKHKLAWGHGWPLPISFNRARQRRRLSEDPAATSGFQWVPTNSINRDAYAGPTVRPLPGRGTMSSWMSRRRERAASSITARFGSSSESGAVGIRDIGTRRNLASRPLSARSQDSTPRTATRKHIMGAGWRSHASRRGGAHSASRLRSTSTTHGPMRAALLYPAIRCRR